MRLTVYLAFVLFTLLPSTAGFSAEEKILAAQPAQAVIIFGGDDSFPPMEWLDHGKPAGFNVDLARAVSEATGRSASHQIGAWPEIVRALHEGRIDAVPMYRSVAREQSLKFTEPFYYMEHIVYARKGHAPIASIHDLDGKRVAVEARSYAGEQLHADIPAAIAVEQSSTINTLLALAHGEAEFAISVPLSAQRLIYEEHLQLEQVGSPFWPVAYAFAVRRDRTDFAELLHRGLTEVKATGKYQEIYRRWEPELVPDQRAKQRLQWMMFGISVLLGVLLAMLLWQQSLRRMVQASTRDLRYALGLREQAETQLQQLANFDDATGLAKPAHFITQLEQEVLQRPHSGDAISTAEHSLVAIKVLDLEASVCAMGYAHAQRIVLALADRLRRIPHSRAAHLGRGVFALFAEVGDGEKLIAELEDDIARSVPGFLIRLAAGSVHRVHGEENAAALLRKAETTLAAALQRKISWLQYQVELEPLHSDMDILAAFKDGDIAGLYPVFQPILNLATGAVESAEALVRWRHAELGEVLPTTLVHVLENSGLIGRLTEMMIDHAVRVATVLSRQGKNCAISVNVAVHDLMEADLPRTIKSTLARHQGRVELLRLELTETGVATDPKRIKDAIDSLRDLGVSLSIDDFGTGFSSLSYLCNFSARDLKIDRSFVTDLLVDKRHSSIVRSTIAMASELGLRTIAEGVEDQQTLDALRAFGCDFAQGFWIASPMTETDFVAFLQAR